MRVKLPVRQLAAVVAIPLQVFAHVVQTAGQFMSGSGKGPSAMGGKKSVQKSAASSGPARQGDVPSIGGGLPPHEADPNKTLRMKPIIINFFIVDSSAALVERCRFNDNVEYIAWFGSSQMGCRRDFEGASTRSRIGIYYFVTVHGYRLTVNGS